MLPNQPNQPNQEDTDFSQSLQDMLGMDADAVEEVIERLGADDLAALNDAVVNDDKARAEQIVGAVDTHETVNSLFRGDLDDEEEQPKKKRARRVEKNYSFRFGDDVQVEITDPETGKVSYEDGTVYLPDGPKDTKGVSTIGVKVQGKSMMVKRDKLKKLEEGVIGMFNMPNLDRMQQLAGIQPAGAQMTGVQPGVPTPEIEVQDSTEPDADPCSAAQQAMQALDVVQAMLPNIRLLDLKAIRQRIVGLQTAMNEGAVPARARKV